MKLIKLGTQDKEILHLAIPALGALIAEPLFLLADAAIIGHLGTEPLAGLGIASVLLNSLIALALFLAYGTTAQVARALGAGNKRQALQLGVDAIWLGLSIGVAMAVALPFCLPYFVNALSKNTVVNQEALAYLYISCIGLPGMLMVLAATGIVRGLQNTATPLKVAIYGAILNVILNFLFVYGLHWGIEGSAWGTVIAQWAMAISLLYFIFPHLAQNKVSIAPNMKGIQGAGQEGFPIFLRTACLRIGILLTTYAAAKLGTVQLAAHQIVITIWYMLAFILDALAIAGQTLTGKYLGANDKVAVRYAMRRMIQWSIWGGSALATVLVLCSYFLPHLFSPDPEVQQSITACLIIAAIGQPIAGYVFILDGILIGAGDGRCLARLSLYSLLAYLPMILWVINYAPASTLGLMYLWAVFGIGYLGMRALSLYWRARSDAWMKTGLS